MSKIMKMLKLLLFCCIALPFNALAQKQVTDSIPKEHFLVKEDADSLQISYLKDIAKNSESIHDYKLYATQNMWTFIKLNTRTGQLWQVQYSLDDEKRFETSLSFRILAYDSKAGRFELYPTQNMYNFILLDKQNGSMWQVQWDFKEKNRGVFPIN